jgi:prephenate dehydrogenase
MAKNFKNILIIGLGLIGGSIASALSQSLPKVNVYGIDTEKKVVDHAKNLGIIRNGTSIGRQNTRDIDKLRRSFRSLTEISTIDLIILCTPVDAFATWFQTLHEENFDGIVTDVGSTKSTPISLAKEFLPAHTKNYVPGHPMAGSESGGIEASRMDLFDGAYWILTPTKKTDSEAFLKVYALLTAIGARVISVNPSEHDRAVAIISHVPHIAASSLVTLAGRYSGKNAELLRLAAGGFKDTTRVAAGSPSLWTGILLNNAEIIADELKEFSDILQNLEKMIRKQDKNGIHKILTRAADIRKSLPAKWVPESKKLIEVRIPMDNRPGSIAEITGMAAHTGCNIQAIEIDHQTEERAVLSLVLTDEGHIQAFISQLEEAEFKPHTTAKI